MYQEDGGDSERDENVLGKKKYDPSERLVLLIGFTFRTDLWVFHYFFLLPLTSPSTGFIFTLDLHDNMLGMYFFAWNDEMKPLLSERKLNNRAYVFFVTWAQLLSLLSLIVPTCFLSRFPGDFFLSMDLIVLIGTAFIAKRFPSWKPENSSKREECQK